MTVKKIAETTALPISLILVIVGAAVYFGSLREQVQAATKHVNESQPLLMEINQRLTRIEAKLEYIQGGTNGRKRP